VSRLRRLRAARHLRTAILVLLLVAGVHWAATTKPTPPALAQEDYHRLATQSEHGVFGRYPEPRRVEVTPVDKTYLQLAAEYVKQAAAREGVVAGQYDDVTRTVRVTSEFVYVAAGLPEEMRGLFTRTLRHEYGHAFAEDILKTECAIQADPSGEMFLAYTESGAPRNAANMLDHVSPELRPVVDDWHQVPANVYGRQYYTMTFGEYLAESYARFLNGDPVPDATRRFLQSRSDVGVY
jgi:hypothetical protein